MNIGPLKVNKIESLKIAVIRIDSLKKLSEDTTGLWIKKQAKKYGYEVVLHQIVSNQALSIQESVSHILEMISPNVIIVAGGTGVSMSDLTIETLQPLFVKEFSSFGSIFANLNFEKNDSFAVIDRAVAGIINKSIVFCIPDAIKICKMVCNELIFPELINIAKSMEG